MDQTVYQAVFESLPSAVIIADDEGRYVSVNKAAEKLLGLPRDQIIGKTVKDFVAPMREGNAAKLWKEFKQTGEQTGLFVISRPDGTDKTVRYTAVTNFVPGLHLSVLIEVVSSPLI